MVTSSRSPILRMGMRSKTTPLLRLVGLLDHAEARSVEGDGQRVSERGFRRHAPELDAEMDDRLGDLWTDATDDAVRAHEPYCGDGFDEMLRDQGINGRHPGDIDNGDLRTCFDYPLQQRFHDDLRARAVECADHWQRKHAVP